MFPTLSTLPPMLLSGAEGGLFLPPAASQGAAQVDTTFSLITVIAAVIGLLVAAVLVLALLRNRRDRLPAGTPASAVSVPLELIWTMVPAILILPMFWSGFRGYVDASVAPSGALKILCSASEGSWTFTYPNGYESEELHVPVENPVTLELSADGAIHSMAIPAFRMKTAILPGETRLSWFHATTAGVYEIFSSRPGESGAATMASSVEAHASGGFARWLDEKSDPYKGMTPMQVGELAYTRQICNSCHTINGGALVGPTWLNLFGSTRKTDKGEVVADEAYLREAILEPNATIVEPFPGVMPVPILTDQELDGLIVYIKSLKSE